MVIGLVLGASGSVSLLLLGPATGYGVLLPALLGLGIGMGFLTAAVVAAAMRAAPADRPGLGTSVNNAARQSAGALGTAVYGAVAGDPVHHGSFVSGIHLMGVVGMTVWLVAIAITVVALPHQRSGPRSVAPRTQPSDSSGGPASGASRNLVSRECP